VVLFDVESDRRLQTKDLECLMFDYWISPAGELFQVDYSHTADLHHVPEAERKHRLHLWEWKPNGNRGIVRHVAWDGPVIVYPSRWHPTGGQWPEKSIWFKGGRIESIGTSTRRVHNHW